MAYILSLFNKKAMKNIIYILFALILISGSCATSGDMVSSRKERAAMKQENVIKAVEAQQMIIKVNRLHSRRGGEHLTEIATGTVTETAQKKSGNRKKMTGADHDQAENHNIRSPT